MPKPKNIIVKDVVPQNISFSKNDRLTEQFYDVTLNKGQWTGMGMFTVPVTETISSSKSP